MALTLAQIQAMITNKEDPRQIINEITDYLEANPPGSPGGSSYLECVLLLTQSGTNAPVKTEILKTLTGNITTEYTDVGDFRILNDGAEFLEGKVAIFYKSIVHNSGSFALLDRENDSSISVKTFEAVGDGTYIEANDYLNGFIVRIEVYP